MGYIVNKLWTFNLLLFDGTVVIFFLFFFKKNYFINKFSMKLAEWKKLENIKTFDELAKRLGVGDKLNAPTLVRNWVVGKVNPSPTNMKLIIAATDGKVSPNDFYS
ncbi:MAG: hypothetical protein Unbinned2350contig1001_30 [Prokaryotic dsDNA virus sp.]|nr:MAG: hypothetical protein Unbinned2350contig1001_30 [Prokaryotic dsDNA virus sp.]